VPCNQFGGQEPGSAEQIATFCEANYGVNFTMLEKQDVNGKDRSPLYAFLIDSPAGQGQRVQWNFEKFLVGRDGAVVGRWSSRTKPDDAAMVKAIETALGAG
jgi:glutathione peroxidase